MLLLLLLLRRRHLHLHRHPLPLPLSPLPLPPLPSRPLLRFLLVTLALRPKIFYYKYIFFSMCLAWSRQPLITVYYLSRIVASFHMRSQKFCRPPPSTSFLFFRFPNHYLPLDHVVSSFASSSSPASLIPFLIVQRLRHLGVGTSLHTRAPGKNTTLYIPTL